MSGHGSLRAGASKRKRVHERGIAPAVARRRAHVGFVLVVIVFLAFTLGMGLAVRFGASRGWLAAAFLAPFIAPCAPLLCRETGLLITEHGPGRTLLTASTLTGLRTVDLADLVRVGGYFLPGRFGRSIDMVIVTDVHGVRVGLASAVGRRLLRQALAAGDGQRPEPRVTRRAERMLGAAPFSISRDLVVPLALSLTWSLAVFLLCLILGVG